MESLSGNVADEPCFVTGLAVSFFGSGAGQSCLKGSLEISVLGADGRTLFDNGSAFGSNAYDCPPALSL